MDTYTVTQARYSPSDYRLGRHVRHDSRSRAYAFRASEVAPKSVKHVRRIRIFDQGQIGSCTGNAALGCLGTGGFYETLRTAPINWTEDEAVTIYARATVLDGVAGTYPPDDTGSDGLSVAQACQEIGLINGYQHAFSVGAALSALQSVPLIAGTDWFAGMFDPDQYGVVLPAGAVQGGHEYVIDEYDAERGLVGCQNSWGEGWGQAGRFYMSVETLSFLLSRQGDVTVFNPINTHAPIPDPTPPAPSPGPGVDQAVLKLAKSVRKWRAASFPQIGAADAQDAVDLFLRTKGY